MTDRSVLVFGPDFGIVSSLSARTAVELIQYVLGTFESLHMETIEVRYPMGKAEFLADVLCEGYHECRRVTSWDGISEVEHVNFDDLEATPKDKLDHGSFHDINAYQLIIKKFAANL
jgi:hypothetical protein